MKDHTGCIRAYSRASKTYYANKNDRLRVDFGMYMPGDGSSGECAMEWIDLNGTLCARLKAFEDSWSALSLFTDLIQEMGKVDGNEIQEPEFCKMLDKCGFKDITEYEDKSGRTKKIRMIKLNMPEDEVKKHGLEKYKK
jgi:hypothetical protein